MTSSSIVLKLWFIFMFVCSSGLKHTPRESPDLEIMYSEKQEIYYTVAYCCTGLSIIIFSAFCHLVSSIENPMLCRWHTAIHLGWSKLHWNYTIDAIITCNLVINKWMSKNLKLNKGKTEVLQVWPKKTSWLEPPSSCHQRGIQISTTLRKMITKTHEKDATHHWTLLGLFIKIQESELNVVFSMRSDQCIDFATSPEGVCLREFLPPTSWQEGNDKTGCWRCRFHLTPSGGSKPITVHVKEDTH